MNGDIGEPSNWQRLPELLDRARSLPDIQRPGFLDSIEDAVLRREVASLLSAATDAESFFASFADVVEEAAAALEEGIDDAFNSAPSRDLEDSADLLPGQSIAQYRIAERLGAGGMGVVYRAFDTRLERTVALKFRSVRLNTDSWSRERFLIEARAAAALDHPNVSTIHEVGVTEDGASFIAMAFYPGETLEEVIRRGPLPLRLALDYTMRIARGLAAAHERGITHRDVKPGNVMITTDGAVKLLDFGIAHMPGEAVSQSGPTPGTIDYMSPEQVSGAAVDHRTDLWSLGVVLYEMCTGECPLRRESRGATVHAILHERHKSVSHAARDGSQRLDRIIDRLLQKDPGARYPTAADLIADLALMSGPLDTEDGARMFQRGSRPLLLAALPAFAGAAVLAVAVWLLTAVQPPERSRILISDGVGDTVSGTFVSEHLRQSLVGARRLALAGPAVIGSALERMGRERDIRLTPEIAHDVALREGIEAYVHVTVDRIGNSFALGALLVETETGNPLDFYAATALNPTDLGAAAELLADSIRERFGDRLETVPASTPRLAVTTDSISALSRYLQAVQANRIGEFRRGIQLLEETTAIDSGFADAYLTKAFALEQIGLRAGQGQAQILAAWQLRDSLTRHERYTVEGDYALHIEGDLGKAVRSIRDFHEEVDRLVPGRVLNRRSYGMVLVLDGRLAEAAIVLEMGRRLAPCPVTKAILVSVLHALHRDDEARTVLEEASRQWPTNPLLATDSAHFAAVSGRYGKAHELASAAQFGASKPFALRAMAVFDAVEGKLGEGTAHLDELRAVLHDEGLLAPALEVTIAIGRLRFVAGDTADGVRQVEEYLARHPLESLPAGERPYLSLALFFADARQPEDARRLLADYDSLVPPTLKGPDRWMLHRVRAALYMAVDRPRLALGELLEARNADRIWSEWFAPLLFEVDARPELARVYDHLNEPDSAIAVSERYLAARVLHRTEMDAFHVAHVRRRLAILYDQKLQAERAAHHRDALATLWRDADPELRRIMSSMSTQRQGRSRTSTAK